MHDTHGPWSTSRTRPGTALPGASSTDDTIRHARRLREVIEHAERAATFDPDPTRRASAERWLEALVDPVCVPPIPPALAPRRRAS